MASTDCQREGQVTVEFGAKFDLSPNNEGYGRIEKISFAAYNESGCLIEAIERFKERTGYYQERVLADQIYWTRENRSYCKEQGIRLSGPKLGRPNATAQAEKNKSTRIISIESKWSALLVWANAVMVWAALPQNWKKCSWLLSHDLYSWRICSESRGEYFVLFCICSDSGMTGADVRVGRRRYGWKWYE